MIFDSVSQVVWFYCQVSIQSCTNLALKKVSGSQRKADKITSRCLFCCEAHHAFTKARGKLSTVIGLKKDPRILKEWKEKTQLAGKTFLFFFSNTVLEGLNEVSSSSSRWVRKFESLPSGAILMMPWGVELFPWSFGIPIHSLFRNGFTVMRAGSLSPYFPRRFPFFRIIVNAASIIQKTKPGAVTFYLRKKCANRKCRKK